MTSWIANINPHPPMSGFPLVIVCLLLLLEALSFKLDIVKVRSIRLFLVSSLLLLVPITYFSGLYGLEQGITLTPEQKEMVAHHQLMGKLILIILVPVSLFAFLNSYYSSKTVNIFYILFIVTTACLVSYTSYRGGELVFKQGVGVVNREGKVP